MSKFMILDCFDSKEYFEEISPRYAFAIDTKKRYAEKHGYTYKQIITGNLHKNETPYSEANSFVFSCKRYHVPQMSKLLGVLQMFYNYQDITHIFVTDIPAFVFNFDVKLEDIAKDYDFISSPWDNYNTPQPICSYSSHAIYSRKFLPTLELAWAFRFRLLAGIDIDTDKESLFSKYNLEDVGRIWNDCLKRPFTTNMKSSNGFNEEDVLSYVIAYNYGYPHQNEKIGRSHLLNFGFGYSYIDVNSKGGIPFMSNMKHNYNNRGNQILLVDATQYPV